MTRRPRRYWSDSEVARLRSLYPTHTVRQLARIFRRDAKSIYNAAAQYDLHKQRRTVIAPAFLASLRRLNRQGYCDSDIAARLGCERHTVSRQRKKLGLPDRSRSTRYVAKVRAATARQCQTAGVRSLADVRMRAFRDFARSRGWPEELRPREVMILDALSVRPMTRREICAAIGMEWLGSRKSLRCGKHGRGSYTANLLAMGLVIVLGGGRAVKGKGKGRSYALYALAPTAVRGETACATG
jgi:hypothetical protein